MTKKKEKFWIKKKVLITGAAGFIGANLTRELIKLGADVHVLIKKTSNKWRLKEIAPHIKEYYCDLSNQKEIKKLVEKIKPKVIYHLATYGGRPFQQDINKVFKTNIEGTENLLNALLPLEYESFINTGTSSEYGIKNTFMKETDILEPITLYAATKASVTLLCQTFAKIHNKPIITLRLFSVYGYWEPPKRLISTINLCSLSGKTLKLTSGKEKHDFVFIEDVVGAYLKAAQQQNISGQIFNIGSGKQYSNDQVVTKTNKIFKNKLKVQKGAY